MRRRALLAASAASGGSNLTFPVTLVEGDNGQVGIDLYNFLMDNKIYDELLGTYVYTFKEGEDVKFTAFGNTENIKQFSSTLDGDHIGWRAILTNFGNSLLSFNRNGHVNVNYV